MESKPAGHVANHLGKTLAHVVATADSLGEIAAAEAVQTLSIIAGQHNRVFLTTDDESLQNTNGS